MAKKAKGKTKPASKNRHNAPRKGSKAKASRPRRSAPKQGALIEDARIGPLDKIADAIGDVRDNMNDLRAEEKGHLQVAKKLMHQYGKTVYKHAGVEIVLVPGDEKVQVRVKKDNGESSSSGEDDAPGEADGVETVEPADGEEGQD